MRQSGLLTLPSLRPDNCFGKLATDCISKLALGTDLAKAGIEIKAQIIDNDAGAFDAQGPALLGRGAAHLVLEGVEHGDAAQDFGGDWRLVRQFIKLAPDVRPAEGELNLLPTLCQCSVAAIAVDL